MSRILRHVGNKDFKRTAKALMSREKCCQNQKNCKKQKEKKQIEEISRPYKSNGVGEINLVDYDSN